MLESTRNTISLSYEKHKTLSKIVNTCHINSLNVKEITSFCNIRGLTICNKKGKTSLYPKESFASQLLIHSIYGQFDIALD